MFVFALLYILYVSSVWGAQDNDISNSLKDTQSKTSRDYHDAGDDVSWRIWGAKTVTVTEVPYAVLYGWYCSGSLIANNWVLSAAHCQEDNFVHAGSEYRSETLPFLVRRHIYHPRWSGPKKHYFEYDLILLGLDDYVPYTELTRPIAIANVELKAGETVYVSGWGDSNYKFNLTSDDSSMSDLLHQLNMTVLDYHQCATLKLPYYELWFGEHNGVTPLMVCAEGYKSSVCFGDSGGPIVSNNTLVGVVSWGVHCEPILMFSNLFIFRNWIKSVTGIKLGSST